MLRKFLDLSPQFIVDRFTRVSKSKINETDRALGLSESQNKIDEADCALGFSESQNKICAICWENVLTKQPPSDQMFGLMTNCKHVFCLRCIRQWRSKKKDFSETSIGSCPVCRIESELVVPNKYWIEDDKKKRETILKYQETHDADEEASEPLPPSEVEAQIGDLIKIHWPNCKEWVIYVGDGYVIHLNKNTKKFPNIWKSRREKLTVIAQKYLCQINNLITASHNRNLQPKPINEVMKSIFSDVDQTLKLPYESLEENSLHYVTKCKFGTSIILTSKAERSLNHKNLVLTSA